MELLKLLSTGEIAAQVINFLLLLFFLRLFFWKRILKALDSRREKISSGLREIEEGRQELGRAQSEYRSKLSDIEEASREKLNEAVQEGKKIVRR